MWILFPPKSVFACEEGIAGISLTIDQIEDEQAVEAYDEVFTFSLSINEIEMLQRITEAECTGQDVESKMNVVSVILNRVDDNNPDNDFPDTIEGVIFQKHQFTPTSDGRYWDVNITDGTVEAVNKVLKDGVTTSGLYFCNKKTTSSSNSGWFDRKLKYLFTDKAGHSFYKNKDE